MESPSTSLDRYLQNSPLKKGFKPKVEWSKKQRRAFQRILSGLKRSHYMGQPIRFMTLTSADRSRWHLMNRDFQVLKQRIKRKYGVFEYHKIRTNEGNGVFHILYRGCYIPQQWLSNQWREIHNSSIVDIRLFREGGKRLARYLSAQYVAGQSFIRMSWSWRWVCKAFVTVWHGLISMYGYCEALRRWDLFLSSYSNPSLLVSLPLTVWM